MGLFGKLKDILFDEETVEIPIITNEEVEEDSKKKQKNKKKSNDEVIVHKIENQKEKEDDGEDLFDMPKLKEEAKEETPKSTFTFPVFEDEERESTETKRREKRSSYEEHRSKKATGFTNAYDYSYGKYKGDYKSSRLANQDILTKSLEIKEEHKGFTPSPIISPVYGILNENYTKEDIVAKGDEVKPKNNTSLDLDSVRRKAYGTLEDDIEMALGRNIKEEKVEEPEDLLKDDGISIDDLLLDNNDETIENDVRKDPIIENGENIFDDVDTSIEDVQEEIDIDFDSDKKDDNTVKEESKKNIESEDKSFEDEEDLFDLIDSIYDRKETE